jgi:HEAT repeat protein
MAHLHRAIPIALIVMMFTIAARAQANPTEAAISHLQSAVTTQRDGSHLPLLFSLRQLHDPTLRPLFHQLVQHNDWQIQVHAVLGLAELDEARQVDPWLVSQVSTAAQEAIIASSLDMGMLGHAQIETLLSRDSLSELPRLMLHAELGAMGQSLDVDDLTRLSEHDDDRVAGLASMLLAQHGEPNAFDAFQSRLRTRPEVQRRAATSWLLEAVRQYTLTAAGPWVRSLSNDADARLKQNIVLTAVSIDPDANIDLWHDFFHQETRYSHRVRAGLLLLACGKDVPPSAFETLGQSQDDPLLTQMAAAGRAVASGMEQATAINALLEVGHPRANEWIMSVVDDLPDDQAIAVFTQIIQQLQEDHPGRAERTSMAVSAVGKLFERAPDRITALLHEHANDDAMMQVLLLGLFESQSPQIGDIAATIERVGFGRTASLALLLKAKHTTSLRADERRQLGLIAAGGGRVSDVLRVQAAWLYLRHTNSIETSLNRIVN